MTDKQSLVHPRLGSIVWNPQLEMWETTVDMQSGPAVRLRIESGEQPNDELFAMAQGFVAWLHQNELGVRTFAAEEMLANYNEVWNDDEPITAQEFADTITLTAISLYEDQASTFFYNDGDLFAGHTIVVAVRQDHTFWDATIAG